MPVKKQKNIPKALVFFYLSCFRMGKKGGIDFHKPMPSNT